MRLFVATLAFCLLALPPAARAAQNAHAIYKAIDEFMQLQIRGLPGNASYVIGAIANTDRLNACESLQVALPQGGRLWGKTNVTVYCDDAQRGWTLYVPVKVKVTGNYIVSSHSLRQGQIINTEDIAIQSGDLAELPNGTLTDALQVIGHTLATSIGAGQPLHSNLLHETLVIRQGQTVKVVSRGSGFEVANEGEALNNATQGQVVRVRLSTGQLVSGVADSHGAVDVAY